MKINPKYIAIIIAIFLLAVFLFWKGCNHVTETVFVKEKVDTITPKIKQNKADIVVLVDSSKILKEQLKQAVARKNYYKQKYKSVYDSVYSASDSVCKSYLGLVNRVKQKQDSTHELENEANFELYINAIKQIGEYQDNEAQYGYKIKEVRDSVKILKDSIPKVKAVSFKEGRRIGRKQGSILTGAVLGAVYIGSKIRP